MSRTQYMPADNKLVHTTEQVIDRHERRYGNQRAVSPSGGAAASSGGAPPAPVDDQVTVSFTAQTNKDGLHGTYELLLGDVDGVNAVFTRSGGYNSGKLRVYVRGQRRAQGPTGGNHWREINPEAGTFQFNTPPGINDEIIVDGEITT